MHFHTGDQTLIHKYPVKEARHQALHPTDWETADGLPGSDPAVKEGRDMTLACEHGPEPGLDEAMVSVVSSFPQLFKTGLIFSCQKEF